MLDNLEVNERALCALFCFKKVYALESISTSDGTLESCGYSLYEFLTLLDNGQINEMFKIPKTGASIESFIKPMIDLVKMLP